MSLDEDIDAVREVLSRFARSTHSVSVLARLSYRRTAYALAALQRLGEAKPDDRSPHRWRST